MASSERSEAGADRDADSVRFLVTKAIPTLASPHDRESEGREDGSLGGRDSLLTGRSSLRSRRSPRHFEPLPPLKKNSPHTTLGQGVGYCKTNFTTSKHGPQMGGARLTERWRPL